MPEIIRVGMGQLRTADAGEMLGAYGIGSCVVVILFDPDRPTGAMLHAILPNKMKKDTEQNKYVDTGVESMIKALIEKGISINNIKAKLFGGAKMFDIGANTVSIGERNVEKAKEVLATKGIEIIGEDTGLDYGRSIEFEPDTKRATVRSFGKETKII